MRLCFTVFNNILHCKLALYTVYGYVFVTMSECQMTHALYALNELCLEANKAKGLSSDPKKVFGTCSPVVNYYCGCTMPFSRNVFSPYNE